MERELLKLAAQLGLLIVAVWIVSKAAGWNGNNKSKRGGKAARLRRTSYNYAPPIVSGNLITPHSYRPSPIATGN